MSVDPGEQTTGNYATQTIYYIGQKMGAKLRRYNADGTWYPWEWENPPMILGHEYRTTERYMGKPVYVFCVDFGALPNNTLKQVNFSASSAVKPIRCSGYAYIESEGRYETLESGIFPTSGIYQTSVWFTALGMEGQAGVVVKTNYDASGRKARFVVHYIKTTD